MTQSAPGKHYRRGLSITGAVQRFSDEQAVEAMFVATRWPDGIVCPLCDSKNVATVASRNPQPFHCRDCRKYFSVKTGTVMRGSNIPLSKWAMAAYLLTTNLKGVSSMKLHRDLGVTQKTAWHMAHRIREAMRSDDVLFSGPVEVDETFIGGKEKNKHAKRKLRAGRGTIGKIAVAGIKDRETNRVRVAAVQATDRETLQEFVEKNTGVDAIVITDEHAAYTGIDRPHTSVRHSAGEYVRQQAHTNGIESHWALLKRGYIGVYHWMSGKHLHRYVGEFEGRHNDRGCDTMDQIGHIISRMVGKRLRYQDLTA